MDEKVEFQVVSAGGKYRCIYINDHRVTGSKPYVSEGLAKKNAKVRLIRDNIVIRDNLTIESLRHFKNDAREVKAGLECGIKLTKFDDVKTDDILASVARIRIAVP